MQALPSAKTSRDSAVPFSACAGSDPWGPCSHAVQLNHEKHASLDRAAQRDRWSPLPGAAASTPQLPQVQSLRLKHRASGRVHPMPGISVGPAQALALLNTSSLAHGGPLTASNLLPHGPFGVPPSNTQQGGGMGASGGSGPCSPFRPAAACSQMVPSPEPPASYRAAAASQQQQQPLLLQPVQVQYVGCWPAPVCLGALQQGQAAALPAMPHLPPFCLPPPTGLGGAAAAGPTQQAGESTADRQGPYSLSGCLAMDFDFSLEFSDDLGSKECSPAITLGLHDLMDEVQEHGDTLTSTLMVNSDIFRPLPLQGCGEAERERLAREAARALRLLHGDSITPSPECMPLLPEETPLIVPPAAPGVELEALPGGQQQVNAVQQAASAPAQVQVPAMALPPAQAAVAAAAKAPSLVANSRAPAGPAVMIRTGREPMSCSPFAGAARQVDSHGISSGYSGPTSSDCGQLSSSGSESSAGGEGCAASSDGGVAALLALCHIANQPEGQAVPVKPEPAVPPAAAADGPAEQPQVQQPSPPRARQQAQRAQQARAGRKPRKLSGGGKGPTSKSPAAAKLGVKRGSVSKARPAQAGSPAAKRARGAPAAAAGTSSPVVVRKAGTKAAGKPAAKAAKPEPKRALSIDLLEAEGCFDMRQDDAAAHMGFGKTWFKEAIKKIGIEKWPYRQLSTLKHNVLNPLEEAIAQHGRLCCPQVAEELLAAVRAECAAVRDKAMRAGSPEDPDACLLSDAMRGLRQDIAYKPRNEAKRAADEGFVIPEEKRAREVQRVVLKWHAILCRPADQRTPQRK